MNLKEILALCRQVTYDRDPSYAVNYAGLELAELAEEVELDATNQPAGTDGILGEAADVLLCVLDTVQLAYPNEDEASLACLLAAAVLAKQAKWQRKHGE